MTDRLYLRHSTDKQTNARQLHALAALIASGAPKYEDPATSSRVFAVDRPGFRALLDAAAVGATIRIADAARLFRSTWDVLQIRDVLKRRGLHLFIATGAWSGFDLAAEDPQTKLFVTMLAGVLEFQRDMISENTREGVAAAAAAGKTLGRPAALGKDDAADVVDAYADGTAVKALARQYGVAPRTVRRVLDTAGARRAEVAHEEPETAAPAPAEPESSADQRCAIDVPGLLAEYLEATTDTGPTELREALREGWVIRRGRGYSLRVTAPLALHRAALARCSDLAGPGSAAAARKAHRTYADRIAAAQP
ncbi:recombinase family protein [Yinghuangia sp. YIM S09857]|uniref:recombinase family protein n=1 Tax=Yinghuangia sp. YIM S09857 TaxID=3436929 RepID=UPI003F52A854